LLDDRSVLLVDARPPARTTKPEAIEPNAPTPSSAAAALQGVPPAGAVRPASMDPTSLSRQLHAAVQSPRVVSSDPPANERWIEEHATFRHSDATTHERAVRSALDFVEEAKPTDLEALSPDARDTLETALNQGLIDADRAPWATDLRDRIGAASQKLQQPQDQPPHRSSTDMGLDSIGSNLDTLAEEMRKAGAPQGDAAMLARARELLEQARARVTRGQEQPMPAAGDEASALMRALIDRSPAPWSQPVR
jgi:hypothetical protein